MGKIPLICEEVKKGGVPTSYNLST
ncbi:uncharacterized protein METZ01_LOCUS405520 [marine metagenome]|uniref:Uncharacterized protein n=1 Tax=marine metagenome TaxID=408172 RepID=A0A382W1E7_9ZZZZ